MKKHSQYSIFNYPQNINDHQYGILPDSQQFSRDHIYNKSEYNPSHNQYQPIYDSAIFPQTGMSHKRQVSQIERKLFNKNLQERSFNFNHSAALYPYSFTEYERLKEKMEEKKLVQDKWLENEIYRIKMEDQLIEAKQKMRKKNQIAYMPLKIQQKKKVKQIFKQARQQLKPSLTKLSDSHLIENQNKKYKKFDLYNSLLKENSSIDTNQISQNRHLQSSQILSSGSKSKKTHHRDQQRKAAIKDMMSRHFSRKSPAVKNKQQKQIKQSTTDRFKYMSSSEIQNVSLAKSKYLNRYSYLFERQKRLGKKLKTQIQDSQVTNEMIDRAFVFDQLKECQSDFEQEGEENTNIEGPQKAREKREYKNSLEILYEKLHKTPERQKIENSFSSSYSQKKNKKSSQKNPAQKQARISKQYICKSEKQLQSSSDFKYPQTKDLNQQKLLQSSSNFKQMQIYNRSSEQHYPVFSPYSNHKHLPHETHEYLTASLERKKLAKHWGALDTMKKQTELKHHHINVRDLIVDEIEKKKIFSKLQQNHLAHGQKVQHRIEISGNVHKQRQEHNVSGVCQAPNVLSSSHQSSDFLVKNLKIELEILRQQLEDKNKKVIDLELQLMQIKNSFVQKKEEKQDLSTTTKSRHQNEDSRKDVCMSEDQECQTVQMQKNLQISVKIVNQQILADESAKKQQIEELFKTKNQVKRLKQKLTLQEEAMGNFFEDIAMYQRLNSQLENKIKLLQNQKDHK